MSISKKNKGFTFSEVLISLTIIGIVAAMTIPNIKSNTNQKGYVTKFRKTYSVLSQGYQLYLRENDYSVPHLGGNGAENMIKVLTQILKAKKVVITHTKNVEKVYNENKGIKALKGGKLSATSGTSSRQGKIVLDDGTDISISCGHAHWVDYHFVKNFQGQYNCSFFIDVNGESKEPNTMGKDIFYVVGLHDGIFSWPLSDEYHYFYLPPVGIYNDKPLNKNAAYATCKEKESSGYGCSGWFLIHDNFDKS